MSVVSGLSIMKAAGIENFRLTLVQISGVMYYTLDLSHRPYFWIEYVRNRIGEYLKHSVFPNPSAMTNFIDNFLGSEVLLTRDTLALVNTPQDFEVYEMQLALSKYTKFLNEK